jgi:ATP-binding cassette subfamily B protein
VAFIIFAIFGAVVLVMWAGAKFLQAGVITFGDLARFVLYTVYVGGAVASFADLYSQIQKTVGATARVRELLDEVPENVLPIEAAKSPLLSGSAPLPPAEKHAPAARLRGDLSFESVDFKYPSRPEVPVLRGLSLSGAAGERIALVGPSGAGKSTVVSLLMRFYEPDAGRILIDGRPTTDYALRDLRGQMAVVPQEVILFGGTVAENIGYGRPGATREEIIAAARQANAHEFIERFPEGYETIVGERGVKLSGGQRQRVAIARAILADPRILILDEATSSLDSESEALIQEGLAELMKGRTTFVIAHRLSTIRKADTILVLEGGLIVERGRHEQLLARGGRYAELYNRQYGVEANLFRNPGESAEPPESDAPAAAMADTRIGSLPLVGTRPGE